MSEEMNMSELFKEAVEENQTRKILEMIEKTEDREELLEKVRLSKKTERVADLPKPPQL